MFEFKTDQDGIDLFCSELGSNDWNPLHDAEKFNEQGLAEKTNFKIKKPIVPGMYELLICELMLKERGYKNVKFIESEFERGIEIGDSILVEKIREIEEKKRFYLYGYRANDKKKCFKPIFYYSLDWESSFKSNGMMDKRRFINDIEIDQQNLGVIFSSVDRNNEDWIPSMFYPSCLVSQSLLNLNKDRKDTAVYTNLLFYFHREPEEIGFGKFRVYAKGPVIIPSKKPKLIPDVTRYELDCFSEKGLCLMARVDLSFI